MIGITCLEKAHGEYFSVLFLRNQGENQNKSDGKGIL